MVAVGTETTDPARGPGRPGGPAALEEDRALLDGFRAGRPAALQEVYHRYGPDLARYLRHGFSFSSGGRACRYNGARSTFDLEDKLQDAFARAFSERARLGYDGISPYGQYLRTIARNLIIDDFRKKEHALVDYSFQDVPEPAGTDAGAYDFVPRATPSPEQSAEQAQLQALVVRFIEGLSARERTIYQLRFEQRLEHKDITEQTGLSPARVKTSEERIRVRFFKFMRKNGYFVGYEQRKGGWLSALRAS